MASLLTLGVEAPPGRHKATKPIETRAYRNVAMVAKLPEVISKIARTTRT
jgi:hypothetical protein